VLGAIAFEIAAITSISIFGSTPLTSALQTQRQLGIIIAARSSVASQWGWTFTFGKVTGIPLGLVVPPQVVFV